MPTGPEHWKAAEEALLAAVNDGDQLTAQQRADLIAISGVHSMQTFTAAAVLVARVIAEAAGLGPGALAEWDGAMTPRDETGDGGSDG